MLLIALTHHSSLPRYPLRHLAGHPQTLILDFFPPFALQYIPQQYPRLFRENGQQQGIYQGGVYHA